MVPPVIGVLDNPPLYCHCEYMSTVKEDRLQIRVNPADKALLERAAAASHLNVSSFVVQAGGVEGRRGTSRAIQHPPLARSGHGVQRSARETGAGQRPARRAPCRRARKFSWLD